MKNNWTKYLGYSLIFVVLAWSGVSLTAFTAESGYSELEKETIEVYRRMLKRFEKKMFDVGADYQERMVLSPHEEVLSVLQSSKSTGEAMQKLQAKHLDTLSKGVPIKELNLLLIRYMDELQTQEYKWFKTYWHFAGVYPIARKIDKGDSTEVRIYLSTVPTLVPLCTLVDTTSVYAFPPMYYRVSGEYSYLTVQTEELQHAKGWIRCYFNGRDTTIIFNLDR